MVHHSIILYLMDLPLSMHGNAVFICLGSFMGTRFYQLLATRMTQLAAQHSTTFNFLGRLVSLLPQRREIPSRNYRVHMYSLSLMLISDTMRARSCNNKRLNYPPEARQTRGLSCLWTKAGSDPNPSETMTKCW